MLLLDDLELDIFSLQDLKKLTGTHFNNVSDLAENLIDKKILSRIERGKYCRANFCDERVIGCHLVVDGAVAYWSALNKHGMTEQFPNLTFIQTTLLKQVKVVFGVRYKFIKSILESLSGSSTRAMVTIAFGSLILKRRLWIASTFLNIVADARN